MVDVNKDTRQRKTYADLPLDPNIGAETELQSAPNLCMQNCLGLDQHAAVLGNFIADCETPMTIGVQGDWGTGKTTLMRFIEHHLRSNKRPILHVRFNTWQYSQLGFQDKLPIVMMWSLIRKLQEEASRNQKEWPPEPVRKTLKLFGKALARAMTLAGGSLAVGALAGAGASVSGETFFSFFDGDEERVDDATLFERLYEQFGSIVKGTLNKRWPNDASARVVFYIDDLDRIEPIRAVELLEVVKNFMDVPGCVFVLAVDFEVVMKGLKERASSRVTEDDSDHGKSFFDKIIQVPYRMPTQLYEGWRLLNGMVAPLYPKGTRAGKSIFIPTVSSSVGEDQGTERETANLASGRSDEAERISQLIGASIGNNPRSLKRLANLTSLSVELSKFSKKKDGAKKAVIGSAVIDQILVLTALQMSFDRAYRLLAQNRYNAVAMIYAMYAMEPVSKHFAKNNQAVLSDGDWREIIERICKDVPDINDALYRRLNGIQSSDEFWLEFQAAVKTIWGELTKRSLEERLLLRWRNDLPILAALLFEALDWEGGKGAEVISQAELRTFHWALSASATAVVGESDPSLPKDNDRTVVSFKALKSIGLMDEGDLLVFAAKKFQGIEQVAEPCFELEARQFRVRFKGETMSLSAATKAVFREAAEIGYSLTASEQEGNAQAIQYWTVVSSGKQQRGRLDFLVRELRDKAAFGCAEQDVAEADNDTEDQEAS